MIRLLVIGLVLSSLGCTKKVSSKLATYEIGTPAVTQVVKRGGTYDIRWVGEDGKRHHEFPVNGVKLQKGDVVGIGMTGDGKILALAAGREIGPLALPSEARHCLWYHKSTRETQLGKNLEAAGLLAGDFAGMLLTNAIEDSADARHTEYEFYRDKHGRLRLTEEWRIPPRQNEALYKEWNYYDMQNRSLNGGR